MAEIDFPDTPAVGEVYDQWTWNGELWVLTPSSSINDGGSGFTFVQDDTPPANQIGDTWYETDSGDSFVWTDDGTSQQWVQFAPGGGGGGGGGDGGSGFTFVQDTQPTAEKMGDTWFDLSTAATGGTSWVAVEESAGGELVWVQFAPGSGTSSIIAPWIRPTLTSPWTDFGSSRAPTAYRKVADNVELRVGAVAPGTTASGAIIFVLPVGYRPPGVLDFIGRDGGPTPVIYNVTAAGEVRWYGVAGNSTICCFYAIFSVNL
jgi:hypothetical protein